MLTGLGQRAAYPGPGNPRYCIPHGHASDAVLRGKTLLGYSAGVRLADRQDRRWSELGFGCTGRAANVLVRLTVDDVVDHVDADAVLGRQVTTQSAGESVLSQGLRLVGGQLSLGHGASSTKRAGCSVASP